MTTALLDHRSISVPSPVVDGVTRRRFITGVGAATLLLAACGESPGTGDAAVDGDNGPVTRQVDALGPVEIPVSPQRVVTLDSFAFEAAMALELPVVGAVINGGLAEGLPELTDGVDEEDPAAVEETLRGSPLWVRLPAVEAGRVAFGGPYWIGSGI